MHVPIINDLVCCNHSPVTSPRRKMSVQSVIPLKCYCNNYPWGNKAVASLSARMCEAHNPDFTIEADKYYAEMWMGTYPELPSYALDSGEDLQQILNSNKEKLIGKTVLSKFGADLPFLPKILSIAKALPLQIHPNIELSKKLHEEDPENFTDTNHKPEIAVALSKFEVFVGFKPKEDIQRLMQLDSLKQFLPSGDAGGEPSNETLKKVCANMLRASEDTVKDVEDALAKLSKEQLGQKQSYILDLLPRLQAQYTKADPGTLVALVLMNFLTLSAGEALYVPADGIHAYLSGDIVECMARSNNVLNTGFCPPAERNSIDLFTKVLTFKVHDPKEPILQRLDSEKSSNGRTTAFKPPMSEFNMLVTELQKGEQETVKPVHGPGIMFVTRGTGEMRAGGNSFQPKEGSIYFVGQGVDVELNASSDDGLTVYRAYAE
jgi:mannose-6-phosphate isomerase